jgi:hypothetical protein
MNLNDGRIVDKLVDMISLRQSVLTSLNLSGCYLSAVSLAKLSDELSKYPDVLRSLNLSYNKLTFPDAPSKAFVSNVM